MPHFVYELSAVGSDRRYIGKAINPQKRFEGHLRAARNGYRNTINSCWIRSHGESNMRMRVMAGPFETKEEAFAEEIRLIAEARATGIVLTNDPRTSGGEDPPNHAGVKRSPETVAKLKVSVKEAMARPEVRKRVSDGQRGKKKNLESIAKTRAAMIGFKHSEQSRKNMGDSHRGKKYSSEHVTAMKNGKMRRRIEMDRWADDGGR